LRNDFRWFRSKMCFRTFSTVPVNSPIAVKLKGIAYFTILSNATHSVNEIIVTSDCQQCAAVKLIGIIHKVIALVLAFDKHPRLHFYFIIFIQLYWRVGLRLNAGCVQSTSTYHNHLFTGHHPASTSLLTNSMVDSWYTSIWIISYLVFRQDGTVFHLFNANASSHKITLSLKYGNPRWRPR